MEDDPRRNTSLNTMNVTQVFTLAIRVNLQKALAIEMYLMNKREKRKLKISKEKLLPPH